MESDHSASEIWHWDHLVSEIWHWDGLVGGVLRVHRLVLLTEKGKKYHGLMSKHLRPMYDIIILFEDQLSYSYPSD